MNDIITAVRIDGVPAVGECSLIMKKAFSQLFAAGGVTYSQFLFPYADSLLLSNDSDDCFFGSHALLWQMPAESVAAAFDAVLAGREDVTVTVGEIELTAASVSSFLGRPQGTHGSMAVGNFAALLSGSIRPWSLREHSRCLCSFAEHIARMKGCTVFGFSGGALLISSGDEPDETELSRLYASKTGAIAEFCRF